MCAFHIVAYVILHCAVADHSVTEQSVETTEEEQQK